jgi:large subunit ribosomal protein L10
LTNLSILTTRGEGPTFTERLGAEMPSQRNLQQVEELQKKLAWATLVVATGFSGMNVAAMTEMRRRLREKGIEYRVVKNTLLRIAAQAAGKPLLLESVEGPTGLLLSAGDPVPSVKVLDEYIRSTRSVLVVRGGVLDTRRLAPAEVLALASLPPRPELLARLGGQLRSPLARLASALQSPVQSLVTVLQRAGEKAQPAPG